jgi:hypothetical protein
MKQFDRTETLIKLAREIHNTAVVNAYGNSEEPDTAFLLKHLRIAEDDTSINAMLCMEIFHLAAGRVNAIAPIPTFWAAKAERFRPQLAITTRPINRTRKSYRRYDGNGLLHIPHYDPKERSPKFPTYIVGQQTCKYTLKDGSNILVNASTEEGALKMVQALAKYVKPSQKPAGGIEANCSFTKRRGKKLLLEGVEMKPFRAAYYDRADKSETPLFTVQL